MRVIFYYSHFLFVYLQRENNISNLEMEREYVYNWCDFLTPCPHKDCEIGSFDCRQCENFIKNEITSDEISKITDDYRRYFVLNKGIVTCKIND